MPILSCRFLSLSLLDKTLKAFLPSFILATYLAHFQTFQNLIFFFFCFLRWSWKIIYSISRSDALCDVSELTCYRAYFIKYDLCNFFFFCFFFHSEFWAAIPVLQLHERVFPKSLFPWGRYCSVLCGILFSVILRTWFHFSW